MINYALAKRRGLTPEAIDRIELLHSVIDLLAIADRQGEPMDNMLVLAAVRQLEFLLQDAWGFDRDGSRHTHRARFKRNARQETQTTVKHAVMRRYACYECCRTEGSLDPTYQGIWEEGACSVCGDPDAIVIDARCYGL